MHLDHGKQPEDYQRYIGRKTSVCMLAFIFLSLLLIISLGLGAAKLSFIDIISGILRDEDNRRATAILWNIRLPQSLVAIISGAGLAMAGCVMQSILRNPLGSPFTLGISHAAAFGAAISVMLLGGGNVTSSTVGAVSISNPFLTTAVAFLFSMLAALIIIAVTKIRDSTPETMVLSGVALGAFFTAGTMLLQFFADDVQLAAMIFWTFGDTARGSWPELFFMLVTVISCGCYFQINSWNYNAIDAGDETAKGLGVSVERTRLIGMLLASMLTAVIISFLGIIGFIGLVVPHMVRSIIGSDHRFLLPGSFLAGGCLLLLSDTVARLLLSPHVLPVSVLTAFLGAPAFFWLIIHKGK